MTDVNVKLRTAGGTIDPSSRPRSTAPFRGDAYAAAELHAGYLHLPCWVRGTAAGNQGRWTWEIRANGTARLVAPDGTVSLIACSRCGDLLRPR